MQGNGMSSVFEATSLQGARLYGILDLGYVAAGDAVAVAEKLVAGGVDVLQLRAKEIPQREVETMARALREVTMPAGVPFIVNDYAEIAVRISAEGVHLGQDDGPIGDARRVHAASRPRQLDREAFIVGRSTHSVEQAMAAQNDGADYIGFGPLCPTPTKAGRPAIGLNEIGTVQERMRIPVFCIGGIDAHNLQAVLDAGARRVVIVSAILRAADIIGYCRDVKAALLARSL
jgi:thiamine-phosphate pyrophosphorylase